MKNAASGELTTEELKDLVSGIDNKIVKITIPERDGYLDLVVQQVRVADDFLYLVADREEAESIEPGAQLPLTQARRESRCRICGERIEIHGAPEGWRTEFKELIQPIRVSLDFGNEFSHTECLEKMRGKLNVGAN